MSISIADICKKWSVSRTTVMKGIADKVLIGEKNSKGHWVFEIDNVIRWKGEPGSSASVEDPYTLYSGSPRASVDAVIAAKDQTIAVLEKQLEVQAEALGKAQDALQTRLLQDRNRNKSIWDRLFN